MRSLRHFFLIFALMVPAAALAQQPVTQQAGTEALAPADKGFACDNDTQCIKIENKCGGLAINRNYMDDYAPIAQNLECTTHVPSYPKDVAHCVNGACAIVHLSDAQFRDEWPKCVKGDSCAVAYDGCQDQVVNTKYANFLPQIKTCKDKSVPHNPDAYSKCINNICVMKFHDQPK